MVYLIDIWLDFGDYYYKVFLSESFLEATVSLLIPTIKYIAGAVHIITIVRL